MPLHVSVNEMRAKLPEFLHEVESADKRIIITRSSRPVAVVLSMAEYDRMLEIMDDTNDPELVAAVAEARADYKTGRTYTTDDLRADMEAGIRSDDLP